MKNLIVLTCLAFMAIACSTTNTYERANPNASTAMVNDKRVITDYSLNDYAYVAGINEAYVSGNLLKIQAKVVNSTTARRAINYKFTWIDNNGMEVASVGAPWQILILEGGESKYISAVATSPNVVDFSLKLVPNNL